MTTEHSEPAIEATVRFLNVDVELFGDFDRAALLAGFGSAVDVLYDGDQLCGGPTLSFELSTARPELPHLASQLVALVRALPEDARAAWDMATRRVFNIGIQAGREPHSTEWTLPADVLAELVEVGGAVTLTVYGA